MGTGSHMYIHACRSILSDCIDISTVLIMKALSCSSTNDFTLDLSRLFKR